MIETAEPIMLSALQHFSYCPRQCALIHLEQTFDDNVHTARGNSVHKQVDDPGYEVQKGVRVERALPVYSDKYGLIGKCDIVEFHPNGNIYPVEYKHGAKRQKLHDDLQLAAQAMCLEEMTGKVISMGAIYHHSSRRRREVNITDELRNQVIETATAIRAMQSLGKLPPPVNDARCKECSLKETCQPEAIASTTSQRAIALHLYEPDD